MRALRAPTTLTVRKQSHAHFSACSFALALFIPYHTIPPARRSYVESLGVPYFYETEEIFTWAAEKKPSSICSFCARMKRGKLYACARREGGCFKTTVITYHANSCSQFDSLLPLTMYLVHFI